MITWDDVAELLAFAAVFDQRKADELDIKAWLAVAQAQHWTPPAAQRAILEHYSARAGQPRIDPATITDRLRTLRGRAAESFEAPRIPDGLPNRDYPAWLRRQLSAHIDDHLAKWASTGEEPSRALPAPPPTHTLAELLACAPAHVRGELRASADSITNRRVPAQEPR